MQKKTISKKLKSKITPKSTIKADKNKSKKKNKNNKTKLEATIHEFNTNGKYTIAIFCDTFYPIIDGVISVFNNYAKRLAKKCNVVVCVPKHKGKTVEKEEYVVLAFSSVYLKFINYDLGFPDNDSEFKSLIRKLRVDFIHIHSPFNAGSFGVKLAKRRKIPVIATFHSQFKYDFMKATKSKALTSIALSAIMSVFNKCDEVWTMHNACANTIKDYGYKGKIKLVPNATDFEELENEEEAIKVVNEKYNLTNIENVFLFVGRLISQKGILFITECLKILKEKNIEFKMIYVGDGPDEDELREKVEETGLQNEIILTGKIMDKRLLQSLYQRSDLFLFPSTCDSSSIVQIEAACHYTPTLFIKDAVTASTITPEINGYVAELDVQKYASKIIEIISNKDRLKEIGENAHRDLYKKWDNIVDEAYEQYVEKIINNKRKLAKINGIKQQKKALKKL